MATKICQSSGIEPRPKGWAMNTLRFLSVVACFVALSGSAIHADDPPYGNVKLLDGYKYKRSHTSDTINGLIYKENGLSIVFESGINEGYAVELKMQKDYIWFRQQEINGHKVFLALTESGVGTKWEPEKPRSPNPRRILMITFPGKFGPMDAANFYAEVLDEKDIADALLMALTFDPSK
jgi:hypothetical protein